MNASTSFSASSISAPSLGNLPRSWSATDRHCVRAASACPTALNGILDASIGSTREELALLARGLSPNALLSEALGSLGLGPLECVKATSDGLPVDHDRQRQSRGPPQGAEDDDPERCTDEIEAPLRHQDPVDEVVAIELVGDPGHVGAARDGPTQSPQALRHDEEWEAGDESGHRHPRSHDHMGDDERETSRLARETKQAIADLRRAIWPILHTGQSQLSNCV